jgi:hypothetical protein
VRAEKDKPSSFFPEAFVNAITVAVKNSPLNAGKLALAKAQAGQYDEAAVKAKIQNLIKDNPVREACSRNMLVDGALQFAAAVACLCRRKGLQLCRGVARLVAQDGPGRGGLGGGV